MINTDLHINLTQPPSEQLIKYLQNLPDHQKLTVRAALAGPGDRIKSTLLDLNIDRLGRISTKEELNKAIKDCYKSICMSEKVEDYTTAIIEAIAVRAIEEGIGQQDAAEQLIFLAARMIKGEGCEHHPNYKSPCRVAGRIHRHFAEALMDLRDVHAGTTYSDKARFALGKLFLVYPKQYALLQIMMSFQPDQPTSELQEEFEEMWCHRYEDHEDCSCWDVDYKSWQRHTKGCGLYAL